VAPNEFQLRAALRQGEGESPDADGLISHAVGLRQQRRRRITAIAGSTAVVAVVALGITGIVDSGNSDSGGGSVAADTGGSAALARPHAPASQAAAAAPSKPPPSDTTSEAGSPTGAALVANGISCPASPDRFAVPGGGGSGQFGSTEPLFPSAVGALRLCGYPGAGGKAPKSQTVTGAQARRIAAALESAPATPVPGDCAPNADYLGGTLEIYPVTPSGDRMRPVVITLGCGASEATNGTALRYVSNLPSVFMKLVFPQSVGHGQPIQGSPVR
jgi:hypothetical protein